MEGGKEKRKAYLLKMLQLFSRLQLVTFFFSKLVILFSHQLIFWTWKFEILSETHQLTGLQI